MAAVPTTEFNEKLVVRFMDHAVVESRDVIVFVEAANRVGLTMNHGTVRNLLKNKKYLGTDFYPAILDQETFEAVETERRRREEQLGRSRKKRRSPAPDPITAFTVPKVEIRYSDPAQQAEYADSLIESEVK